MRTSFWCGSLSLSFRREESRERHGGNIVIDYAVRDVRLSTA